MLEKALEESAIPFFQVESNIINLWRNCQKFSLEQLLAATRAMRRRGREWETTTQTCVLCLTFFLSPITQNASPELSSKIWIIPPLPKYNYVPSYNVCFQPSKCFRTLPSLDMCWEYIDKIKMG
jgi:hypothetical protein